MSSWDDLTPSGLTVAQAAMKLAKLYHVEGNGYKAYAGMLQGARYAIPAELQPMDGWTAPDNDPSTVFAPVFAYQGDDGRGKSAGTSAFYSEPEPVVLPVVAPVIEPPPVAAPSIVSEDADSRVFSDGIIVHKNLSGVLRQETAIGPVVRDSLSVQGLAPAIIKTFAKSSIVKGAATLLGTGAAASLVNRYTGDVDPKSEAGQFFAVGQKSGQLTSDPITDPLAFIDGGYLGGIDAIPRQGPMSFAEYNAALVSQGREFISSPIRGVTRLGTDAFALGAGFFIGSWGDVTTEGGKGIVRAFTDTENVAAKAKALDAGDHETRIFRQVQPASPSPFASAKEKLLSLFPDNVANEESTQQKESGGFLAVGDQSVSTTAKKQDANVGLPHTAIVNALPFVPVAEPSRSFAVTDPNATGGVHDLERRFAFLEANPYVAPTGAIISAPSQVPSFPVERVSMSNAIVGSIQNAVGQATQAAQGAAASTAAFARENPGLVAGVVGTVGVTAAAATVATVVSRKKTATKKAATKKAATKKAAGKKAAGKKAAARKPKKGSRGASLAREDRSGRVSVKKTYRGHKVLWTDKGQPYYLRTKDQGPGKRKGMAVFIPK